MLVSVIIPCFNSAQYIEETLKSVSSQQHSELEIICVDNGSTDSTCAIINTLQKKDKRIILINEYRSGANYARNTGLKAAKGVAVQFLDSDDVIEPDKIKFQLDALVQQKAQIIVSDRVIMDHDLKLPIQSLQFEGIAYDTLATVISTIITTCNPLYLKATIDEVGGWDESLKSAQDWEFNLRLALKKKKFVYVPGYFLKTRSRVDSLSSNWVKVNFNGVDILDRYREEILKTEVTQKDAVGKKIFFLYFIAAIHSKEKKFLMESLKKWRLEKKYSSYLTGINKILLRLFGLRFVIFCRSLFSKKHEKSQH